MSDVYWKKLERKISKLLGGKRRIFGGVHSEKPIDVEADGIIVDVKSTKGKKSITIKREDLEDIQNLAEKKGVMGAIAFQYYYDRNQYIILNIEDFLKLRS
ncbi:MAG: hypothetical protein GF411_15280 [Candidatus Lokiarchaeota archaeon]|nr:hypothetical protein [Candidatus Lokiarchaeota archaeon]